MSNKNIARLCVFIGISVLLYPITMRLGICATCVIVGFLAIAYGHSVLERLEDRIWRDE